MKQLIAIPLLVLSLAPSAGAQIKPRTFFPKESRKAWTFEPVHGQTPKAISELQNEIAARQVLPDPRFSQLPVPEPQAGIVYSFGSEASEISGSRFSLEVLEEGSLTLSETHYPHTLSVVIREIRDEEPEPPVPPGPGNPNREYHPGVIRSVFAWYDLSQPGFPMIFSLESNGRNPEPDPSVSPMDLALAASLRKVYPTVAEDEVFLSVEPGEETPESVEILNRQGISMGWFPVRKDREDALTLKVAGLPPGYYHIRDFSRFRQVKKMIPMVKK